MELLNRGEVRHIEGSNTLLTYTSQHFQLPVACSKYFPQTIYFKNYISRYSHTFVNTAPNNRALLSCSETHPCPATRRADLKEFFLPCYPEQQFPVDWLWRAERNSSEFSGYHPPPHQCHSRLFSSGRLGQHWGHPQEAKIRDSSRKKAKFGTSSRKQQMQLLWDAAANRLRQGQAITVSASAPKAAKEMSDCSKQRTAGMWECLWKRDVLMREEAALAQRKTAENQDTPHCPPVPASSIPPTPPWNQEQPHLITWLMIIGSGGISRA